MLLRTHDARFKPESPLATEARPPAPFSWSLAAHLKLVNRVVKRRLVPATFYIQAASYTGAIAGGLMTDRWVQKTPRARIYTQALGMAVAAPFLVLLSVAGSQPVLLIALVTFGLGRGLFDCNTMPILLKTAPQKYSATGYGLLNSADCLIGGAGAALAGFVKEHIGLSAAF